jgi:rubrerythrin
MQLSKSDDLPKVVCSSCFECLTSYLKFHITSLDSYQSLRNTHSSIGIKTENLYIENVWTADFLPKREPDDDVESDTEKMESLTCRKEAVRESRAAAGYEDPKRTLVQTKKPKPSDPDRLCNVCGKIVRQSSMVAHMKIHGSKKYICDLCGYSVVLRSMMEHSPLYYC